MKGNYKYIKWLDTLQCIPDLDKIISQAEYDPNTPDDVKEFLASDWCNKLRGNPPSISDPRFDDYIPETCFSYVVEYLLLATISTNISELPRKDVIPCKKCIHREEIRNNGRLEKCRCKKYFQRHDPNFFCASAEYDEKAPEYPDQNDDDNNAPQE